MGKIDSREIGEVDSHSDSASSLLLIKYATESQCICFQPQREEAAQEWKGRNISHHLSVHRLSLGLMKVNPQGQTDISLESLGFLVGTLT